MQFMATLRDELTTTIYGKQQQEYCLIKTICVITYLEE